MVLVETLRMDEKGRLLIPKEARRRIKTKEFVIIQDQFGTRIVPRRTLKELFGISPVKVGTENLREKEDDKNRIF